MCCGVAGFHRLDFFLLRLPLVKENSFQGVSSTPVLKCEQRGTFSLENPQLDLGLFTALVNSVHIKKTCAGSV